MDGKIEKVEGLLDGTYRIALLTPVKPEIRALMGKPVQITISAAKARRSLDANAYYWKLLTQLAEKIGTKKSYISKIENGHADVQLSTLFRIFSGLGKRVSLTVL